MNASQLGPYIIKHKLGAGGMGDVFASEHQDTKEPAAIKVLPSHLCKQLGFRTRFEVEIETLRRLDHPNIVRIIGFGEQEGTLFYAMELVEGKSLEDAAQQGKRLPWRQVVDIAQQLCKALKHAHDRGIIHRDIKPANIMQLADGQVKLADFGIAQLYGVTGLTIDGGVVGTASYLSPEQADGLKTSPRSDLYSLGATLYALLTGRPPFIGKTLPELLRLQRTATPSAPSLLAPDIPCELDAVILGLLAKAPTDRIGAPMMLAKSLQAVQDAADLRTPPPTVTSQPAASPVDATQAAGTDATLDSPHATSQPISPTHPPVGQTDARADADATMASQGQPNPNLPQHNQPSQPAQPASKTNDAKDDPTLASLPAAAKDAGDKASQDTQAGTASNTSDDTQTQATGAAAQGQASPADPDLTQASQHASLDLTPASASTQALDDAQPSTMFMTAEEAAVIDRQRQQEQLVEAPRELPIGIIAMILFAVVLTVAILYVLRPPSADTLFDRINKAATSGDSQQVLEVDDDIDEFESLYPDDPRTDALKPIKRRIDQIRNKRVMPIAQKHFDTGQNNLPVAQLRDQAILLSSTNPQQAVRQLDAILTLYGDPAAYDDQQQSVLQDIKFNRDQLAIAATQSAAGHLLLIRQRLTKANELLKDDPTQTAAIAQAIIDLYGDKPWAAEQVKQAQNLIKAKPLTSDIAN